MAMVLRALLPAGWTPAAISSANASPFVICTMDGPLHPQPAKHDQSDRNRSTPCVFAAAAHLAPPAVDAISVVPASVAAPIFFASSHDALAARAIFRPNAARAPPASV
jgi:hypothetical protein